MIVKKALEVTLHNLKIEQQKTEKTITLIQSFLIDQHKKNDQLNKDIHEATHALSNLEIHENTRS